MYYSHTAISPISAQIEMTARNGYVLKTFYLQDRAIARQELVFPTPIDWQLSVSHNLGKQPLEVRGVNKFKVMWANNGSYRPTAKHAQQR